jgi:ferritin-like metal-binding protein YciE
LRGRRRDAGDGIFRAPEFTLSTTAIADDRASRSCRRGNATEDTDTVCRADPRADVFEAGRVAIGTIAPACCLASTEMEDDMADKDLNELFLDTLKDIYYAEKQILKALPKMAKAAQSDKLRSAFEKHHEETEGQIERLEQVFELLGKAARGKKCDAIEGILDEGKEIMEEYADTPALDAGLLAAAQAVEHYEIARYGTLKAWALKLNNPKAAKLIDQTLSEEKKTDDTLTKIAETAVNYEAAA